jgi:hypothetical protein
MAANRLDASLAGIRHLANPSNVRADIDLSVIERRITGITAAAPEERDIPAAAAPPEANEDDGLEEANAGLQKIAAELGITLDTIGEGKPKPARKTARVEPPPKGLGDFVAGSADSSESEVSSESGSENESESGSENGSESGSGSEAEDTAHSAGGTGAQSATPAAARAYAQPFTQPTYTRPLQMPPTAAHTYAQPFTASQVRNTETWVRPRTEIPDELRQQQITRETETLYQPTFEQQLAQADHIAQLVDEYHDLREQADRLRMKGMERFPDITYDSPEHVIVVAHRALKTQMQGQKFTHMGNELLLELASAMGDICDGSWRLFGNFHPDLRGLRNSLSIRLPRMRTSMTAAVKHTFGAMDMSPWGEVCFEVGAASALTLTAAHRRRTAPAVFQSQQRADNIGKIAESRANADPLPSRTAEDRS